MTTRVTLQSLPDGQMVVEKVALVGDLADRRAEAHWLASARDPGVVQLVAITEDPFTITTTHAGATTLRTDHITPDVAAAILASVCDTLAGLHERKIAHGKLTLDHVVISTDGEGILCSPDGTITDPIQDLARLGQMTTELVTRWQGEGDEIQDETQWLSLADRLTSDTTTLTARRAGKAFARLGPLPQNQISGARRAVAPRPTGRILTSTAAGLAAVGAAAFLVIHPSAPEPGRNSVEIAIGQDLYAVGRPDDVVLSIPDPCAGQPAAVLLDRNSVVWTFDSVKDGAAAQPLLQIPGATDLSIRSTEGCSEVWASGPAGQTLVVGS